MALHSPHVLVTGGTGFVATHLIEQLITAGFKITATSRDASKAAKLFEVFPLYKGNVTFVSVPDFTAPGAFDKVFVDANFDYIFHTASPLVEGSANLQKDIIDPGPFGVNNLFQAAHKFGGSGLKRIILTSSGVATFDPFAPTDKAREKRYDEQDWNPITAEAAVNANHPGLAYFASKTLAENAAWAFVEKEKPTFDLTAVLPVIVIGPSLTPVHNPNDIEAGAKRDIYGFLDGTYKTVLEKEYYFYSHIDVRDVARSHILAALTPSAGSQRIMVSSEELYSPQTVVNSINKTFPELSGRVATGDKNLLLPPGIDPTLFSGTKAYKIFGDGWFVRSLDTTIKDTVGQILEQEKTWKKKGGAE